MSFLLDPPLLVTAGATIERLGVDDRTADALALGTAATFVGVSALLYLRVPLPGLGLIWKPFRTADSRDFMLGSGVRSFAAHRAGPRTHALAAAILATYPGWLALGRHLGRRRAAAVV